MEKIKQLMGEIRNNGWVIIATITTLFLCVNIVFVFITHLQAEILTVIGYILDSNIKWVLLTAIANCILIVFGGRWLLRIDKFRDNVWIIVPAVLIVCFLILTTVFKSLLGVNTMDIRQSFVSPVRDTGWELHVEYPRRVSYNTGQTSTIQIWAVCVNRVQPCPSNLRLSSYQHTLQFALDGQTSHWKPIIKIFLSSDGKAIPVRVAPLSSQATLDARIKILPSAAGRNILLPDGIHFEGARDAKIRLWGSEFLGTGSFIISVIIAIFAGIKQLSEEKKREMREIIQMALDQFDGDGKNMSVLGFLKKWEILQKDWRDWSRKHHSQFEEKFKDFLRGDNFLPKLGEESTDIQDVIPAAKNIYKKFTPEGQIDFLQENFIAQKANLKGADRLAFYKKLKSDEQKILFALGEVYQSNLAGSSGNDSYDVYLCLMAAAITLLGINRKADKLAVRIIEKIPEKVRQTIFDKIRNEGPQFDLSKKRLPISLSKQLKDVFRFSIDDGYLAPEYPLARRFDVISLQASQIEQDSEFRAWLTSHPHLNISPFFDAASPYAHIVEKNIDLRNKINGLFQKYYKTGQKKFVFQNDWDLRAGLYSYCRGLGKEGKTFFVLLPPSNWYGYENADPRDVILHALANEWLYTLILDDDLFFELNPNSRQALCRLLVWHCNTMLTLKMTIEKFYFAGYGKISSKKLDILLETIGQMPLKEDFSIGKWTPAEIDMLTSLRPAHTVVTQILCLSIDLDNEQLSPNISTQQTATKLNTVANWLKTLHIDIVYFISGDIEPGMSLFLSEEDLILLCNDRLSACPDRTIHGLDELFMPHADESAELILARKAHGSPGVMIRLGQQLLLNHCRDHPDEESLDIQELLDLKE